MRRTVPVILLAGLLLVLVWWVLSPAVPPPTAPVLADRSDHTPAGASDEGTLRPPPRPPRLPERRWTPPELPDEAPLFEALEAVGDEGFMVSCPAPGALRSGPPRTYGTDGADDPVIFSAISGAQFVARVRTADGEASVQVDLEDVGTVRWSGLEEGVPGTCDFVAPRWTRVTGRVEGTVHPGLFVRGCGHAAIVPVRQDGTFSFVAAQGTTCYPFAFEETETFFSRGAVTTYVVDGSPLVLSAPDASSREDLALQRERLAMAATMFRRMDAQRATPIEDALSDDALDPAVIEVLERWSAAEQAWSDLKDEHLEEMEADDADPRLYRNLWLNLY